MNYLMCINCGVEKMNDSQSLLVLGAVILEQDEMEKVNPESYKVVVGFQLLDDDDSQASKDDYLDKALTEEFELLYERLALYLSDKGPDAYGIMMFSDQGRTSNQALRRKCRELMEGKGDHPNLKFKMSGGLNIQEEAKGLNLATKVTDIALKGLKPMLSGDIQKFWELPFREQDGKILGYGITSRRTYRPKVEVLEKLFHEWKKCKKAY